MPYQTHELSLELPDISMDRTVNVLTLTDPGNSQPFQVIMNRDLLLGGESLEACVARQIGLLRRQTQSVRIVAQQAVQIGPQQINAIEVESSFAQGGNTFHQLQALFVTDTPKLMAVTLSSPRPLSTQQRQIWTHILSTLALNEDQPVADSAAGSGTAPDSDSTTDSIP